MLHRTSLEDLDACLSSCFRQIAAPQPRLFPFSIPGRIHQVPFSPLSFPTRKITCGPRLRSLRSSLKQEDVFARPSRPIIKRRQSRSQLSRPSNVAFRHVNPSAAIAAAAAATTALRHSIGASLQYLVGFFFSKRSIIPAGQPKTLSRPHPSCRGTVVDEVVDLRPAKSNPATLLPPDLSIHLRPLSTADALLQLPAAET